MSDSRSVMKEYRSLDQKRLAEGLTADEEARYAELRDLVGAGAGSGSTTRPGFDVSAAAARLRESLLPAGLRQRPPPTPEPSPEPIGEIEELAPAEEGAAGGEEQSLPVELEGEGFALDAGGSPAEAFFDPGSLAAEPATDYDPNAAPYDPNAAVYDPNAAAYDPNAAVYDPNAAAYDPNAAVYDPNAAAYDPNAAVYDPNAAAYDPNAAAYDPNAAAYDPNAAAYDPNAAAYDPNAAAYDPNAAAYDPNAAAYDPNAAAYDPNAAAYDPNAAAYDPNAAAYDPNAAAYDPNAAAYDPNAAAYDPNAAAYDPNAAFAESPSAEGDLASPSASSEGLGDARELDVSGAALPGDTDWSSVSAELEAPRVDARAAVAADLDLEAAAPLESSEPLLDEGDVPAPLPGEGEEPAWAPTPGGDYDAASWDAPGAAASAHPELPAGPAPQLDADPSALAELPAAPSGDLEPFPPVGWSPEAPAPEPATGEFGAYDEVSAAASEDLEALLPFDPAAESAVGADALRAFDGPPVDLESAGFGRSEAPSDLLDREAFHAAPAVASEEAVGWEPEPSLVDQGFQLESGGSFDAAADAAAPEWAAPPQPMPWEEEPAPEAGFAASEPPTFASEPEPTLSASVPEAAPLLDAELPPVELATGEGDEGEITWMTPLPEASPEAAAMPALDLAAPEEPALAMPEEPALAAPEEPALAAPEEPALAMPEEPALAMPEELAPPAPEELAPPSPEVPAPLDDLDVPFFDAAAEPAEDDLPTLEAEDVIEELPPDAIAPLDPQREQVEALEVPAAEIAEPPLFAAEQALVDAEPPPVAAEEPPVAPPAHAEAAPEPEPFELPQDVVEAAEVPQDDQVVRGVHRAVVHTLEGQVKRGFIEDADLGGPAVPLSAAQGAEPELLPTDHVKAIFFMLGTGEQPPAPEGSRVRVTFRDGRQVAGFSPGYRDDSFGFFMIPADARTSTSRIWVYRSAVKQVAVS